MGSIRAIRGGELTAGPASEGTTREIAEVDGVTVGISRREPGTTTGWHHHGEHTVYVFVAQGQVRIEWGPSGGQSIELADGDFYVVGPNTIHREENPGSEDQVLAATLVGSGPVAVNVDGPET